MIELQTGAGHRVDHEVQHHRQDEIVTTTGEGEQVDQLPGEATEETRWVLFE